MSIQPPQGILNIPNATLRVGKLAVDSTAGFDTVFNNVERNTILLVDSTEYTDTKQWDLKMPNIFVTTFEIKGDGSSFNFRNTSNGDATTGYTLTFSGTTLTLKYNNASLTTATIPDLDSTYGKVYLTYEKQHFTVTVDGTLVLNYKDTGTRTFPEGEYVNFFAGTGSLGFKNLKVVAGHFISDGTSNIAYVGGGEVAVGKALAFNRVSNVSQIKVDSNVVAEYTGPHDRPLRKYPEVAILSGQSGLSGGYTQDGYVVEASSEVNAIHPVSNAFNHIQSYQPGDHAWISGANTYGLTDGLASSGTSKDTFQGVDGSWLGITLPVAIRLDHVHIYNRFDNANSVRPPKTGIIWASNDGTSWYNIFSFDNLLNTDGVLNVLRVNNTNFYTRYRVQITAMHNDPQKTSVAVGELEFYGYEEGSGSIDTTLKSVYNVPATTGTQLEVYYDGQDYTADTDFDQANEVLDKSGNNLHGSQTGGVGFDSTYKAFTFGAGDYIQTQTLPSTFIDDAQHSIAMWFNLANLADTRHLFWIDDNTTGVANQSPHAVISSAGILRYDFFANDIQLLDQIVPNQWYHLVITFSGGNHQSGTKFYINGVHNTNVSTPSSTATLDIQASSYIVIGANNIGTTSTTFNGSIANFRLYSKALNAGQVQELYDYQKDYFLGTHSSVTLHKGRFGVGTKEPMKELDVVGDVGISANLHMTTQSSVLVDSNVVTEYTGPHDRPLRKYPEVALTANSDKGYVASASSSLTSTPAYLAFDGSTGTTWHTQYPYYTENGGVYDPGNAPGATGTHSGILPSHELVSGYAGEYITLSLPNKIKMSKISINTRVDANLNLDQTQSAEVIVVVGSHDGSTWEFVDTHTVGKYPDDNTIPYTFNVNTSTYYEHVGLICTNTGPIDSVYNTAWSIAKLAFYGYEEGSGSLDTTLKSVYNVPATTGTQLEVYYDGQDYTQASDFAGSSGVVDKAGGDQDGTASSGVSFDSTYKAFVFDGSSDTITGTLPSGASGEWVHSVSLWFKRSARVGGYDYLFKAGLGGTGNNGTMFALLLKDDDTIWTSIFSYDTRSEVKITSNQWYHLAYTYTGGAWNPTNVKMYLNGEHISAYGSDTNPLTLSGTNLIIGQYSSSNRFNGSIANFRLYSKVLNADQVKELYDYQKDYFLGSKSQVTLYKGHLGVGVTEPSGQLELAGDERIQEYPPRGFGVFAEDPDYSTHIEGHGVFTAYGSSQNNTGKSYSVIGAFDKTISPDSSCWLSKAGTYSTGNPVSATAAIINGIQGEFIALKSPYPIKLKSFTTQVRGGVISENSRMAKSGIIWGSNNGATWYQVHSWSGRVYSDGNPNYFEVNSTEYYSHHALQTTETQGNVDATVIGEWKLFGTPGPTTLDKGSLTLGRSLDVPRISRYDVDTETPRPEKLLVDFDTTVNSTATDISGQGNHGTFKGTASYSPADKAFVFDGDSDYIEGVTTIGSGNQTLCFSMWLKPETDNRWFIDLGKNSATGGSFFAIRYDTYYQFNVKNGNYLQITAGSLNTWEHLVIIHHGTGSTKTAGTIEGYVNGVPGNIIASDFIDDQLSLSANPPIEIGARTNATNTYFDGQISNFKLYNVALEPSEVKKLYNLGRTGRSMVISDTAVGIGKVPEANLDVRGSLAVRGGNVMIEQDFIKVRLASDPGYLSQIQGGSMYIANPSTSGGYEHFIMNNSTTGSHQTTYFSFRRDNSQIGSILTSTGSTISFNTGSDYRLKENIVDMPDVGLEIINKLRPKTFNFKKYPGETVHGFIAHELQEHIPIAVSGEKDEMRGEEPMYQGVDASKIVPWLVKAIQELYEENQTLKTRLDTLEGA